MKISQELLDRVCHLIEVRHDIDYSASTWIKRLREIASSLPEATLDKESQILRSMSDPTRLKILHLLSQGERELCVCEIQVAIGKSQPLTSHHLNELHKAGLVGSRRIRGWVYYRLSSRRLKAILRALKDIAEEVQEARVEREPTPLARAS